MSDGQFSFARHALVTLGSATAGIAGIVIALTVLRPGPTGSLIIVVGGLVATVLLLGWAARTNLARHERGTRPAGRPDENGSGPV